VRVSDDGAETNWSNDVDGKCPQRGKDSATPMIAISPRSRPALLFRVLSWDSGCRPHGRSQWNQLLLHQVAGEGRMMMHRNAALYRAPMAVMTRRHATHNADGPVPTGGIKDGAINAIDRTAQTQKPPAHP